MPPCGGHPAKKPVFQGLFGFKSCPRVGGIVRRYRSKTPSCSFKSCPRVGGITPFSITIRGVTVVSSRAPVWGASCDYCGRQAEYVVSSRAPVWGASPADVIWEATSNVSSRAPVWGASWWGDPVEGQFMFQVVPPCGGHLSK